MKKLFLYAIALLVSASYAHAAKQSGTFTCSSGVSIPLTSFYLEVPNSSLNSSYSYVTITTDTSQFVPLFLAAAEDKHYSTCEVQVTGKDAPPSTLKFTEVVVNLVSVTGDKQSQYVTATFNFSKIEDEATPSSTASKGAALTPEQQNKALTEFLARAPKPSAN